MTSVLSFWREHKGFFQEKSVQQIIALCGDGRLRDQNATSAEFRELLDSVSSQALMRYAEECLQSSFDNSGLALQDIVNQVGARLGFQIEHGLYRGRVNQIGFDGLWAAPNGYQLVVEVKTTDSYRINLDTIAAYRSALIEQRQLTKDQSSVLIVVGRQDTGDLEAQIRGSRHAWDIRLISIEALLELMAIKENLSDAKTAQQIAEVLKPLEYTRLDRLINIMFTTSEDLQSEVAVEEQPEEALAGDEAKAAPANFHEECIERISHYLSVPLIKEGRNRFTTPDKEVGISCAVSKEYARANETEYWYAFHPSQREYLHAKQIPYIAYGCGSPEKVILFPFSMLEPLLEHMWTTKNEQRHYWHIKLHETDARMYLGLGAGGDRVDVSEYLLPSSNA